MAWTFTSLTGAGVVAYLRPAVPGRTTVCA